MTHSRLPDATPRLRSLLAARARQPFVWGRADCWLLAADAVLAVTGRDPAADVRATYTDRRAAARLLRHHGGWAQVLADRVGAALPAGAVPWPGDVVQLPVACGQLLGGAAMGVVWAGTVVAQGAAGLVQLPLPPAARIWRAAP